MKLKTGIKTAIIAAGIGLGSENSLSMDVSDSVLKGNETNQLRNIFNGKINGIIEKNNEYAVHFDKYKYFKESNGEKEGVEAIALNEIYEFFNNNINNDNDSIDTYIQGVIEICNKNGIYKEKIEKILVYLGNKGLYPESFQSNGFNNTYNFDYFGNINLDKKYSIIIDKYLKTGDLNIKDIYQVFGKDFSKLDNSKFEIRKDLYLSGVLTRGAFIGIFLLLIIMVGDSSGDNEGIIIKLLDKIKNKQKININ